MPENPLSPDDGDQIDEGYSKFELPDSGSDDDDSDGDEDYAPEEELTATDNDYADNGDDNTGKHGDNKAAEDDTPDTQAPQTQPMKMNIKEPRKRSKPQTTHLHPQTKKRKKAAESSPIDPSP